MIYWRIVVKSREKPVFVAFRHTPVNSKKRITTHSRTHSFFHLGPAWNCTISPTLPSLNNSSFTHYIILLCPLPPSYFIHSLKHSCHSPPPSLTPPPHYSSLRPSKSPTSTRHLPLPHLPSSPSSPLTTHSPTPSLTPRKRPVHAMRHSSPLLTTHNNSLYYSLTASVRSWDVCCSITRALRYYTRTSLTARAARMLQWLPRGLMQSSSPSWTTR